MASYDIVPNKFYRENKTIVSGMYNTDTVIVINKYWDVVSEELIKGNVVKLYKNLGYLVPILYKTKRNRNMVDVIYIPDNYSTLMKFYTCHTTERFKAKLKKSFKNGEYAARWIDKYKNNLNNLAKSKYEI